VDEVCTAEHVDELPPVPGGGVGDSGGSVRVEFRARVQAEQPERPPCGLGQVLIGPGEHGSDAAAGVPTVEQIQSVLQVGQFSNHIGQRFVGADRGEFRGHPEGEG
jgi:hypothetical protein